MPSRIGKPKQKGTLIRGADGILYFITDSKMGSFAVPEAHHAETKAQLYEWTAKGKDRALDALCGVQHGCEQIEVAPPPRTRAIRKSR